MPILVNGQARSSIPLGTSISGYHWRTNPGGVADTVELALDGHAADGLVRVFVGDVATMRGVPITISSALSGTLLSTGAGGLDTGSVAATKCYVWRVITTASGGSPALLAHLTSATPTMPSGYTLMSDVIALSVTDGSSHQYECCHSSGGRNCFEFDVVGAPGIPVLTNGTQTTETAIGQVRALSTVIPSCRREGEIQFYYEALNSNNTARNVYIYNNDGGGYCIRAGQIGLADTPGERRQAAGTILCLADGPTIDTSLYYKWSGAATGGLNIWVDKVWI